MFQTLADAVCSTDGQDDPILEDDHLIRVSDIVDFAVRGQDTERRERLCSSELGEIVRSHRTGRMG